jgi:hypothetical protein
MQVIDWLSQNNGAWIAIIMALLTFLANAWLTIINRRMFLQKREPQLLVFWRPSVRHFHVLELVIANVGEGAAREIEVRSHRATEVPDLKKLKTFSIWIPGLEHPQAFDAILAAQEIAIPVGVSHQMIAVPELWPMTIYLQYWDSLKSKKYQATMHIDPMSLKALRRVGDSALNNIAKATREIAGHLKEIRNLDVTATVETRKQKATRLEVETASAQAMMEEYRHRTSSETKN